MSDSEIAAGRRVRLQIVAAGNGWEIQSGSTPAAVSTYLFLDCEAHPELLALVDQARSPEWAATASWSASGDTVLIDASGPSHVSLEIPVLGPSLEAVRHARRLVICPTTPALGLSPSLARDRSFQVDLPRRSDA